MDQLQQNADLGALLMVASILASARKNGMKDPQPERYDLAAARADYPAPVPAPKPPTAQPSSIGS